MTNVSDVSSPPSDAVENDYNRIYETLVPDDRSDDLAGLIAYALYKRSKKEFVADLWQRERRKPDDSDLRQYVRYWTESRLKALQSEAQAALNAYGSAFIDSSTPEIREAAIKDEVRGIRAEVAAEVRKSGEWPAWRWSVVAGIAAAACYTGLLILAASIIKLAGIDLLSLLK